MPKAQRTEYVLLYRRLLRICMRGDAKLVHSVDSSAKAIDLTNKNIELNFPGDTRHAAYAEDAFNTLTAWATNTT